MKKLYSFLFFSLLLSINVLAQEPKRYFDKIFSDVQVIPDQVYGENYTFDILKAQLGYTKEQLSLDIYLPPSEDTVSNRPLIIWAHGGSFLGGTKADKDIVYFCNEYAKRGFVCVSINYRTGYELPIDSVKAVRAVYRALQDGRASVRYMRVRADEFNIDPNRIYFGGTSAGAFIAMNMVYLNQPIEVPSYVDTSGHDEFNFDGKIGLDGIEGLTNTLNQPSTVQGIINYCGATKTTAWMNDSYAANTPIISMHGTKDGTVPYGTRVILLNDLTPIPPQIPLKIVEVQGSYDIARYAKEKEYNSVFYTWYGADHVPYINYDGNDTAAAYMDTVMQFTVKHVYERFLGFGTVAGIEENEPPCDFNKGIETPCDITAVGDYATNANDLLIYPNPSIGVFTVNYVGDVRNTYQLLSITGKQVLEGELKAGENSLNCSGLAKGIYTFVLSSANKTRQQKVVLN